MGNISSKFRDKLSKCNRYQIVLILIFLLVSSYSVVTASSYDIYLSNFNDSVNPVWKHFIFMCVGIATMLFYVALGGKGSLVLRWTGFVLILAAPVLLLWVSLFGKTLNGATRWISIGGLFDLQPSEVIKLSLIFYISAIVTRLLRFKHFTRGWGMFAFIFLLFVIPLLIIAPIALQHSSTGIIMLGFLLVFYFLVGMPFKIYSKILMTGVAVGALFALFLMLLPRSAVDSIGRFGTMRSRIESVIEDMNGETDEFVLTDKKRQEQYSKIALANGFLLGQGPGNSKIKDVLPMANTDYIYAVLVEEFGIFALLGVPALYIAWLLIAYSLSKKEESLFRRYLLYGIGLMYPMQALVHFVVVAGIIPTGQPLPFISSGGSSLITSSLAMGIMLFIGQEQNMKSEQRQSASLSAEPAKEEEHD